MDRRRPEKDMTVTLTVAEHCWSCGCKGGGRTYRCPAASTEHAKPVLDKNKLLGVRRTPGHAI